MAHNPRGNSHSLPNQDLIQRLMAEMNELRAHTVRSGGQDPASNASHQASIAVVPGPASNNAAIYNYQSPSSSTANNSTLRYTATATTVDPRVQGTARGGYQSEQVGDERSPVDLMEALRQTPRNPAYAHPSSASSRQPPQFLPNYPLKGKGTKKPSATPSEPADPPRPKGKPLSFGKNVHTRFHLIMASPLLRTSLALFSSDEAVMKIQLQWLIDSGHSREVELYASYTNKTLEDVIRLAFESNPPAPQFDPVKFPPGHIDLVKHQPNGVLLSPDTRPVITLPNGGASIVSFLKSCAHAFIVITEWREPSYEQHVIEQEWMERWFRMTKKAYIDLYGQYDDDETPFMTSFLANIDKHAEEGYSYRPQEQWMSSAVGVNTEGNDNYYAEPLGRGSVATAQVQVKVNQYPRLPQSEDDDDDDDEGLIDAEAALHQMFNPTSLPAVAEDAKYLLGRKIQLSILNSEAHYHHFKDALQQIKDKKEKMASADTSARAAAGPSSRNVDVKPNRTASRITVVEEEDVKPDVTGSEGRVRKRARSEVDADPGFEIIDIPDIPQPQPRRLRLTVSSSASLDVPPRTTLGTADLTTATAATPGVVPSVLAPAPTPVASSTSIQGWEAPPDADAISGDKDDSEANEAQGTTPTATESIPARALRSRAKQLEGAN
ncbi:hypothetical protein QFC20_006437 [Naganishia adeliensis]|uniref:Uncharacterized protein n=1 Tax=Naganishia adeliensis TaxID=92952 RepID=A0ACC2VBD5_9TREE|nr:hypothetical protein QFC20_006437 [Naganishia adeliensis]